MRGKVVVVTGALGALGAVAVNRARERGATAVPVGRKDVDLSDAAAAERFMQEVKHAHGRIDALLNIAGGFVWAENAEPQTWRDMFAMNLETSVNATRAALRHLIEVRGAVVNVGANGALKAGAGMGPYAASKSGVHRFTEALAEEMRGQVRVNAVLPTTIDTPRNRADMPSADFSTWVAPEDLSDVMLFLASNEARAITGALIPVSAGRG